MTKHKLSQYYYLRREIAQAEHIPVELWREKIGDHINYLLLLTAIVEGGAGNPGQRRKGETGWRR